MQAWRTLLGDLLQTTIFTVINWTEILFWPFQISENINKKDLFVSDSLIICSVATNLIEWIEIKHLFLKSVFVRKRGVFRWTVIVTDIFLDRCEKAKKRPKKNGVLQATNLGAAHLRLAYLFVNVTNKFSSYFIDFSFPANLNYTI